MFSIEENIPVPDNETKVNITKNAETVTKAVDMRSVDVKVKTALQYAASKNYKKAAEQYLLAATEFSSNAGDKGLPKDKNTQEQLYKNAAEMLRKASHKDEYVLANLGVLYYYGRGVKQDLQQATYYLTKPKMLEEANACYCLGMLYYEGKGSLKKNTKKAMKYLAIAAEQNIPEAQNALGKLYYLNAETEQDNQNLPFFTGQKHCFLIESVFIFRMGGVYYCFVAFMYASPRGSPPCPRRKRKRNLRSPSTPSTRSSCS